MTETGCSLGETMTEREGVMTGGMYDRRKEDNTGGVSVSGEEIECPVTEFGE